MKFILIVTVICSFLILIKSHDVVSDEFFNVIKNLEFLEDTITPVDPQPTTTDPKPEKSSLLDKLTSTFNGVNKVTDGLKSITEAVKSSHKSAITQTLVSKGFEHFAQSATLQRSMGVDEDKVDEFLKMAIEAMHAPEDKQAQIANIVKQIKWVKANTWALNNILFNAGENGTSHFITIFSSHDKVNKEFNFIICSVHSDFKLGDDILVITKSLAILGEIWSQDTLEYKKMPRSLTEEDMKTLINFFTVVTFKTAMESLGIPIELPKM